jgi:hypothetical protein
LDDVSSTQNTEAEEMDLEETDPQETSAFWDMSPESLSKLADTILLDAICSKSFMKLHAPYRVMVFYDIKNFIPSEVADCLEINGTKTLFILFIP